MAISTEGKLGLAVGLLGLGGGGALWVAPTHTEIGWLLIAVAGLGAVALASYHFRDRCLAFWHRIHSRLRHHARLSDRLYVGHIVIGIDKLQTEHWIEISIVGFNGYPRPIHLIEINGHATYSYEIRPGSSLSPSMLPTPTIMPIFGRVLAPLKEFYIALQQNIPAQIADNATSTLGSGLRVTIAFENLNIVVSTPGKRIESARLLLWDGVTMEMNPQRLSFGRLKSMQIRETLSPLVKLG